MTPHKRHNPIKNKGVSALWLSCAVLTVAPLFSVAAQEDDSAIEISGDASMVVGVVEGETKSDLDARIKVKGSTLLDNGLEIGGVVEARGDADIHNQYWAGGRYSSLLAGGDRGVGPEDSDVFLQSAYGYIKGGFGEISVGRDNGIASQLAVTSPTVFSAIGVNDWKTDLTGLNDVQTINDFSGYSTKLTYMPPANFLGGVLGGVQLGVSYSPQLRDCAADELCAPANGYRSGAIPQAALNEGANWRDVVETAIYYEKALNAEKDVRLGLGASYVSASEDVTNPDDTLIDDYKSVSLGLNLAIDGLTLGGSVKNTNSGLANDDDGYLAFDAGVTYEAGPWGFMLGYGAADADHDAANLLDPSLYRETQSAQAGVSYVFDQGVTLGAAAQFVDSNKSINQGGDEDAAAVLFESSIKF
ncbi:MAG: porin [bacterium]